MSEAEQFLAAACEAVRRSGDDALDALGWWELLSELDDPDARTAIFTLFRAQGRELASTAALGGLLASPYLDPRGGAVAKVISRQSPRRGTVAVVVGTLPTEQLLVDLPGGGAALVDVAHAVVRAIDIPGRLALHEVDIDLAALTPSIRSVDAERARARSTTLGRLAMSFEMIGAAEAVLDLAVDYAGARLQFGRPIGSFQAVRHLLAWARAECAAASDAAELAVRLGRAAPDEFDGIVKALAGRNARRVCEQTLQCFGGIGFTAEHDHHHFHSRVLALDALLSSSAELTLQLGRRWRREGADLRILATLLVPDRALTT